MRRVFGKFARCSAGVTAIEFGMIGLPLLLAIFGIIEFGRLMWTREALQETAIAGARCMGMTQSSCGTAGVYNASMAANYIQAQGASWSIPLTASNMSLNASTSCGGIPGFSRVSLTFTFNTIVPLLIKPLGGVALSASACFPNHT